MRELWKPIPESNDFFVSNLGNVCRILDKEIKTVKQYRARMRKSCKLKEDVDELWYPFVKIEYGDIVKNREVVHRLVAKAFVNNNNSDVFRVVNHIDGVKSNNVYTNLEWCDYSRNNQHAFDIGLNYSVLRGTNNPLHKLTEDDVREIFKMRGKYPQNEIAAKFGINQSNVSRLFSEEKWAWLDDRDKTIEPLPLKKLLRMDLPLVNIKRLVKPYYDVTFRTVRGRHLWKGVCPKVTANGKVDVFRFDEKSKRVHAQISASAMVYVV